MRLLVIDDDKHYLDSWAQMLRAHGHSVKPLNAINVDPKKLAKEGFDLALVDSCLSESDINNRDGLEFAMRLQGAGIPSVLVTAYIPAEAQVFELLRQNELAGIVSKRATDGDERVGLIEFYALNRKCANGIAHF